VKQIFIALAAARVASFSRDGDGGSARSRNAVKVVAGKGGIPVSTGEGADARRAQENQQRAAFD